jgi:hypothetical protein
MLALTAFFAASPLNPHATYVENLKSWSLPSNGSMYLQVTPHANWVGHPVRRVIPLRYIDPRRWFDRTPTDRPPRWEYWPQSPAYLVWATNQGAKMERMPSRTSKLIAYELEDVFLERVRGSSRTASLSINSMNAGTPHNDVYRAIH